MFVKIMDFLKEEQGQGMAEYGLILSLVAVAAIVALGILSGGINKIFTDVGNKLNPPPAS